MSVTTRPRSCTTHRPSTSPITPTSRTHFRPLRYQTKEELDRFFGTTAQQKREQRLRVRETDGSVFFDAIEKDEWQHLLATATEVEGRRRSSVGTSLTLNSPLALDCERSCSVGDASPARFEFQSEEGEREGDRVRRRKRSNSVGRKVDDTLPNWNAPVFKRRQSSDGLGWSPRQSTFDASGGGEDRIRISRLPLSRRKLDQETMDQAFGSSTYAIDPLSDITNRIVRSNKPSSLTITPPTAGDPNTIDTSITSPTASTPPQSPLSLAPRGERRGTFGALPSAPPVALHSPQVRSTRWGDLLLGNTPPSSAAIEFLNSPTPTRTTYSRSAGAVREGKSARHVASFDDIPKCVAPAANRTLGDARWAGRQRYHSAEGEMLRPARSVASLRDASTFTPSREMASGISVRTRKTSHSSDGSSSASDGVFTSLVPRRGAKKLEKKRQATMLLVDAETSPTSTVRILTSMRDPITGITDPPTSTTVAQTTSPAVSAPKRFNAGLGTGPSVYLGIDIPCASIHLHSDPEDNIEPALALTLSNRELRRKLKKKSSTSANAGEEGKGRGSIMLSRVETDGGASGGVGGREADAFAKGSSRWWSSILHG
ncbi:hypothetical protein PHBOTO_006125 [Pseudozyma hubeiensis]|nr:hypothetical protein PHBOTO_006125 [Pseudozyma hubeiensis]